MNISKKTNHKKLIKHVELVDDISNISFLLEKADVLSEEILTDYLEKVNFKSERGKLTAEYDLKIARVKANVVCNYIKQAVFETEKLLDVAKSTLDGIKKKAAPSRTSRTDKVQT